MAREVRVNSLRKPYIKGLTTNLTLTRKVGLTDYETFARAVLKDVKSKPISFKVFSDDFPEMRRQALKIHDWQDNFYVKTRAVNPQFLNPGASW
jgi:transaldolase